jgi:hypothetical protein
LDRNNRLWTETTVSWTDSTVSGTDSTISWTEPFGGKYAPIWLAGTSDTEVSAGATTGATRGFLRATKACIFNQNKIENENQDVNRFIKLIIIFEIIYYQFF